MIGFQELAPAVIVSAFGFGMILAVLGSLKPFLSEKMEIPEGRIGHWISAAQLALIRCRGACRKARRDRAAGRGHRSGGCGDHVMLGTGRSAQRGEACAVGHPWAAAMTGSQIAQPSEELCGVSPHAYRRMFR